MCLVLSVKVTGIVSSDAHKNEEEQEISLVGLWKYDFDFSENMIPKRTESYHNQKFMIAEYLLVSNPQSIPLAFNSGLTKLTHTETLFLRKIFRF